MKHLGDITKISGYTAPIVDCIIGGSPCQDLSVAGKRAGLDGERSGLYMEQIRIVKEMRAKDERNGRSGVDIRPRYMVWENVPGAFSSNKGEDFRIVLEELAKIADKDAVIPMPEKGKWTTCGCILGDGWSIAWRVLDAQFWGVPQRRRRIALVADFGGQSASEILFVRKSLSGYSDESKQERQDSSTDATRGTGADDCYCYDIGEARLRNPSEYKDLSPTITQRCGTGGNNVPAVVQPSFTMQDREGKEGGGKGALIQEEKPVCFAAHGFGNYEHMSAIGSLMCGQNQTVRGDTPLVVEPVYVVDQCGGKSSANVTEGTSPTLTCTHGGEPVIALDRASFNQGKNAQYDFEISDKGVNSPLVAKGPSAVCYNFDPTASRDAGDYILENVSNPLINGTCPGHKRAVCYYDPNNKTRYIVRRLTPLECERLQGYPDGWTDIGEWIDSNGKKRQTSDAARYKALGNSIALPPWKWVLKRLCACYERDATMASLFDGIGGFPYLWEQLNGKGTCLWASEIEEFPMAVTKVRIGG